MLVTAAVVVLTTLLAGPLGFVLGLFAVIGVSVPLILHRDGRRKRSQLSQNVSELEDRVEQLETELQIADGENESADESPT
ncbi:hypothetical protein DV733_13635 [Halapricum salinum]|uniref:Uncharacterized protein n=2 Tax=Halapricum salinum TaxID=1457250 RepID=A0A4D6HHM6_9EURY|nr:hypothetical protein DV733_13635 [Halapricum salinum]